MNWKDKLTEKEIEHIKYNWSLNSIKDCWVIGNYAYIIYTNRWNESKDNKVIQSVVIKNDFMIMSGNPDMRRLKNLSFLAVWKDK